MTIPSGVDGIDQELIDAVPDALLIVGRNGSIAAANAAASELLGRGLDDLRHLTVHDLIPPEARDRHERVVADYVTHPQRRDLADRGVLTARRADGCDVPVLISLAPVVQGGETRTVAILRDLSIFVQTEARARREAERLLRSEVRQQMARDLHDSVIQQLFAAGVVLGRLQSGSEAPSAAVDNALDLIDGAMAALRDAIDGHGVTTVSTESLADRLVRLTAEMAAALPAVPDLQIDGDVDSLPDDVASNVLHVVSESLANVARHAQASDCGVVVRCRGDSGSGSLPRLVIEVWDDGVGALSVPEPDRWSGLSGLAARAAELGGVMEFIDRPSGGLVVHWSVPLDRGAR